MKFSRLVLAGIIGLLLQGVASAQVYESKDAEGVPEFSDTPAPGAEAVEIPSTNLVDAPAEGQPDAQENVAAPAQPGPAPLSSEQGEGESGTVYYGGDEDEDVRAQRRLDEERIDEALPGNQGPGVGAPGRGIEPGPGVGEPRPRPEEAPHAGGVRR